MRRGVVCFVVAKTKRKRSNQVKMRAPKYFASSSSSCLSCCLVLRASCKFCIRYVKCSLLTRAWYTWQTATPRTRRTRRGRNCSDDDDQRPPPIGIFVSQIIFIKPFFSFLLQQFQLLLQKKSSQNGSAT